MRCCSVTIRENMMQITAFSSGQLTLQSALVTLEKADTACRVSVRAAVECVLLRVEAHLDGGRRRCQQRTDRDAQAVHPVLHGVRNSSWSAKTKARFVEK